MTTSELTIRSATPEDRPAIVELCRASLGWKPDDPNAAFFSWKHDDNAFGPSPAWVAESDGRLLGVRVFLRWRFRHPDGTLTTVVRAVDTATHPDAQGRGIFTKLTLGALPDLDAMGVDAVFNTPNDKSRPGYLKMGWSEVGKVPVAVRIRGLRSVAKVAGARAAAEKWSQPTSLGLDPLTAFADDGAVERLLALADRRGIATDRSAVYFRWRYSFGPLAYRVEPVGDALADGVVVFRLRRRGAALEATIAELLAPSPSAARSTVRRVLRSTGADYAIAGGGPRLLLAGFVPAPPLGPILTWKPVRRAIVPSIADLGLAMGDVELF